VLKLCQRLGLVPLDAGHLQDHWPPGEIRLLGQEDAGESTPAKLLTKTEPE
jgi:hypothetical protein